MEESRQTEAQWNERLLALQKTMLHSQTWTVVSSKYLMPASDIFEFSYYGGLQERFKSSYGIFLPQRISFATAEGMCRGD